MKSRCFQPRFHGNVLGVIRRTGHVAELQRLLKSFPVVAIVGARQIGKTTLGRVLSAQRKGPVTRFDLEDPRDLVQPD